MNNDMWRECNDPDELAAAVAAQMRVEKGGDLGTWDLTRFDTPDEFRSSLTAGYRFRVPRWWKLADEELVDAVAAVLAGEDGYDTLPQHHERWTRKARAVLAAFPLAAPDGGGAAGAERYLDGRMDDPEYARARCDALLAELAGALAERDELAARLAQVPEVPDGHELVVLPTKWANRWAADDGPYGALARAAIARRPKPEPRTERVPWWEAVGRQGAGGHLIAQVERTAPRLGRRGATTITLNNGWNLPIAPDGTVEVLRDGAR